MNPFLDDDPQAVDFWGDLRNPRSTGGTLAKLHAKIPHWGRLRVELLEALARHPNCPPEVFAELLLCVPQAAVENPAWELLLLAGVLADEKSLLHQLQSDNLPRAYVALLSQHPSPQVRLLTQEHVALAGEVEGELRVALFQRLATLHRDGRLVWLARFGAFPERLNDYLPYPVVASPARRPHPLVKRWRPEEEILDLLNDADGGYEPREAFLESCAQSKGELAPLLAMAQVESTDLLYHLASRSFDWRRRLGVVLNPRATLLSRFAKEGNRWVRAVARQRLADPSWRLF